MDDLLIEPVYAGPVSWYKAICSSRKVVFDVHSFYEKRSYRNRCEILGANGVLNLSIPLESGKHQKQLLKDVRISYAENWQKDHWVGISSAYRRAAFFEYYEELLHPFYEQQIEFLTDYNTRLFDVLSSILNKNISFELSEQYIPRGEFKGNDCRDNFLPNKKNEIPPYLQVFADRTGFVPDLSLLDVLFNLGTRSMAYLDKLDTHL